MTDNIKKNKNQHNDAIEYEPNFDNDFILSSRTKEYLPVVTVRLRGGKKQRETIILVLIYLWDSRATDNVINRWYTKPYERKMSSNNVEYSKSAGPYWTTNGVKVPFCMPYFSISKIISHRFHVYNNWGKSVIVYDMIIGCDFMDQLGILADFKYKFLQWDGATVPMK